MKKRTYHEYGDFTPDRINQLLKSKNVTDKLDALLYTVLNSDDYERSNMLTSQFIKSDEIELKRNAIVCIGHLARIHNRIDLEKYLPILDDILSRQNELLVYNAEDTLNDIWIFCNKKKIKEINKYDFVGRYFNVLEICDTSENDENFDWGIMIIKELEITESNPSIKRVLGTSLKYLNNFR